MTWQEVEGSWVLQPPGGGQGAAVQVEVGMVGREMFRESQQEVEANRMLTGTWWERVVGVDRRGRKSKAGHGCVRGHALTWPPELV